MSLISGTLPAWLCENSLQKILESKLNKNCKVLKVDCGKGSTAGDHYLSEIVRLSVLIKENGKEEIVPLIIKDVDGGWQEYVEEMNTIEKEIEVYSNLISYANSVLSEPVAADCYFVSSSNCLLLEDLSNLGYRMVDRLKQLDYEHSRAALKSLAQFHAASVKLLEISPNSLAAAGKESCFVPSKDTIAYNLNKHCMKTVINTLKQHHEGKKYVEQLNSFLNTFWRDIREAVTGDFDFKVLNHGDFWLTNILFKYREGKVDHCRLVDFQLTRYCSPCYDIHLLTATSIRSEVRDERMDDLLNEYLITLNTTLTELGSSKSLSRESLDEAMDRTKAVGILLSVTLAPVVLLDPKRPLQLEGISKAEICGGFKNADPFENYCNYDLYLNHIISLLQYYRRKHYI